ncbi:MAG: RecX family transcriptional regulator [Candidatus Omnitrophica bacterium]|nr:RecX family transcriptional regulator [Candidatus Omnitrophota bacterium]
MSSSKPGDDAARLPSALPRYLRSGVRSTREVLTYLRRRGCSGREASRLVSRCRASGALDDRLSARLCAGHWARQGYASAAIRVKLAGKGFEAQLIHEAITRYCPPADDEARARLVLHERARRWPDRHAPSRLAGALASRGFDSDVIERVLADFLGPAHSDAT